MNDLLTKLFVHVPKGKLDSLDSIIAKSKEENNNKIYFVEGFQQIVLKGTSYGVDKKTSKKIESLITAIGGSADDKGIVTVDFSSTNYAKGSNIVDAIGALDAKLNEELIKLANSKTLGENYEFTGKLQYVPATGGEAAYIVMTNEDNNELPNTKINISEIIGNGVLDHSEYVKETGILHLWFKQADGSTRDEQINLAEMLDIDDVLVKSGSENYLEVANTTKISGYRLKAEPHTEITEEAYNALPEEEKAKYEAINEHGFEIGAKVKKIVGAGESADLTGLANAADVKAYVDSKATDLAVTAKGDDYVSAYVNAAVDKKHVIVDANVQDVTYTGGTHATYNNEGAKLTDPVAANILGVANSLVDGAQATAAIKSYIDFVVAEEALRADANVLAKVKALDKASATVDGSNVHITYKEEDGIVTIESVAEDYATVTRGATTSTSVAPVADASLTVKEGDEAKLVKAADIKAVADYAADKVTEEAHRVDKKIADTIDGLDVPETEVSESGEGAVKFKYSETDGKVAINQLSVTYAEHSDNTLTTGVVTGTVLNDVLGDMWETYVDA